MPLTDAQRAQACPSCRDDPHAAPSRYCAPMRCTCAHPACPAFASYRGRQQHLDNVHPISPPPARQANDAP